MGRRVEKVVSTWNGSAYASPVTTRFLYDGWNLLAELDGDNSNAVKCSYMWGLDLSGSLQGAGGVGGLLTVSPGGTNGYFAVYDGNGNVTALSDSSGKISARYEYDPFGQTIRATGAAADSNPIRFSTKYSDSESGFCYYGYRFYNASLGRWVNRDPLAELGGPNLVDFVFNSPANLIDLVGLDPGSGFYSYEAANPNGPRPRQSGPDCSSGFCVIGSAIMAESPSEKAAVGLGIDHVDISYNGSVIYVGLGGAAQRAEVNVTKGNYDRNPLTIRKTGIHKAGSAKDCPCAGDTGYDQELFEQ